MGFKRCLLALVSMGLTFLFTPTVYPADKSEIESLRGLTGVFVAVEKLDNEIKRELPFDEDQIRADVELKLRMAEIKVFSKEKRFESPGSPCLYVNLNALLVPEIDTIYYALNISLEQAVYLERNLKRHPSAVTWWSGSVGAVGKNWASKIRDSIKDKIDRFINDHLSVNPKGGK